MSLSGSLRLKLSWNPQKRAKAAEELGRSVGRLAVISLASDLGHKSWVVRRAAAESLGQIADPRAESSLIKACRDADSDVRRAALLALTRLGQASSIGVLLESLDNTNARHRDERELSAIAEALGRIGDRRGVNPLVLLLTNPSSQVRQTAAAALIALQWKPTNSVETANLAVALRQWEQAIKLGANAIPPLMLELKDVKSDCKLESATALGRIGKAALVPLATLLATKTSPGRTFAVHGLVEMGSSALDSLIDGLAYEDILPEIISGLRRMGEPAMAGLRARLSNKSPVVRRRAAAALKELGFEPQGDQMIWYLIACQDWKRLSQIGPDALPPLLRALDGDLFSDSAAIDLVGQFGGEAALEWLIRATQPPTRHHLPIIIDALSVIADPRTLPALERLLQEEYFFDKAGLLKCLGAIGGDGAVRPLKSLMGDRWGPVRKGAADELDKLNWQPKTEMERASYLVARREWAALVALGPSVVEALMPALNDPELPTQIAACEVIVRLSDGEQCLGALKKGLVSDDEGLRLRSIDCLEVTRASGAIQLLRSVIVSNDYRIRRRAANALAKSDPGGVDFLLANLDHKDESIRLACAAALGETRAISAVEPLTAFLDNSRKLFAWDAARVLGEIGDHRAVPALLKTFATPGIHFRTWEAVVKSLGQLADPRAIPVLITAFATIRASKSDEREQALLRTLGSIAPAAVDQLIAALRERDAPIWAIAKVLGDVGDKRAVDPLIECLRNQPNADAVVALGLLGDSRAADAVITALQCGDDLIARLAATALGQLGSQRAVEPLMTVLKAKGFQEAADALAELADARAVETLLENAIRKDGSWRDEYRLDPSHARGALSALRILLEKTVAQVDETLLLELSTMQDLSETIWFMKDGCTRDERVDLVSSADIRQIVRQELAHRGTAQ